MSNCGLPMCAIAVYVTTGSDTAASFQPNNKKNLVSFNPASRRFNAMKVLLLLI